MCVDKSNRVARADDIDAFTVTTTHHHRPHDSPSSIVSSACGAVADTTQMRFRDPGVVAYMNMHHGYRNTVHSYTHMHTCMHTNTHTKTQTHNHPTPSGTQLAAQWRSCRARQLFMRQRGAVHTLQVGDMCYYVYLLQVYSCFACARYVSAVHMSKLLYTLTRTIINRYSIFPSDNRVSLCPCVIAETAITHTSSPLKNHTHSHFITTQKPHSLTHSLTHSLIQRVERGRRARGVARHARQEKNRHGESK